MYKILFLLVGIISGVLPITGQTLEADRQHLFKVFPVVHKMKSTGIQKYENSIAYKFVQGDAKYRRDYTYLAQKLCSHTFILDQNGKRYCLRYLEPYAPRFYTEIYSDEKEEWVKSEYVKCPLSELPYNMRHTISIDQGTLSSYK